MISIGAIHTGLRTALNSANTGKLVVVSENDAPSQQQLGSSFLMVNYLDARPDDGKSTLGVNGEVFMQGIFLVTVLTPKAKPQSDSDRIVDQLVNAFRRGTAISTAAINNPVIVQQAWRNPAVPDQSWYRVPVSIHWWALVPVQ